MRSRDEPLSAYLVQKEKDGEPRGGAATDDAEDEVGRTRGHAEHPYLDEVLNDHRRK